MDRTPGFIIPSSFSDRNMLMAKLKELNSEAGFTVLSPNDELTHHGVKGTKWGVHTQHYLDKPESPEDILHFGVKGMHWGVKKAAKPTHPDYGSSSQAYDKKNFGKGGVARINDRLHKGQTIKEARNAEYKHRRTVRRRIMVGTLAVKYRKPIIAGAKVAGFTLGMVAGVAAQHIAVKAETNRGRAAAANLMGIPSKGSNINYANKKRGAYNISSL